MLHAKLLQIKTILSLLRPLLNVETLINEIISKNPHDDVPRTSDNSITKEVIVVTKHRALETLENEILSDDDSVPAKVDISGKGTVIGKGTIQVQPQGSAIQPQGSSSTKVPVILTFPTKRKLLLEGTPAPKKKRLAHTPTRYVSGESTSNFKITNFSSVGYSCDLQDVTEKKEIEDKFGKEVYARVKCVPHFISTMFPLVPGMEEHEYVELIAAYNKCEDPLQKFM